MDVSDRSNHDLVAFALGRRGASTPVTTPGSTPPGSAWDLPDEWQRTIDVNLGGVLLLTRGAPADARGGRGAIVASAGVARIGRPGTSPAYNASKAGIIGLTVSFSAQVADRGVRVNAIMPSLVESRDFGWSAEERAARIREYPLGIGAPSDVGEAVLYLVSPAARWVSGTALQVNGGYQRHGPWL